MTKRMKKPVVMLLATMIAIITLFTVFMNVPGLAQPTPTPGPTATPTPTPIPTPLPVAIPGQIEAENWNAMSGVQTETTSDTGGGLNVGWIDAGDWMDYNVDVNPAGTYLAEYRVASPNTTGTFDLKKGSTVLGSYTVPQTGGWQAWTTISGNVSLSSGVQTLRIAVTGTGWNINWMKFSSGPTSGGVISTGQRTIIQPLSIPATDLHFIVYQADRSDAWILDWAIKLNIPFTKISAVTGQWPFNDGGDHSVIVDIEGINVPGGTAVDIIATLNLNTYNTVKFADIKWTYASHDPVDAIPADIGWAVATNPGSSQGGWLISKYTVMDLNGKSVAVDLVGHQFLATNTLPAFSDLSITNGTPSNPGSTPVKITDWGVAIVPTLPSWNEINNWQNWDQYSNTPVMVGPGQTVQFPNIIVTATPVATPIPTPSPQGVISTGQRTIIQPLSIPATDLHFIVYQADRSDAWILGWGIELSTPFTSIHATPSQWPFTDGRIHSVTIDIEGINVPYGTAVNIIATLNLNTYNTVKFADIKWTYANHDPVSAMPDIGWAVATNPGASQGGWLISKYTVLSNGNPPAVDLVGHQFLATNTLPAYSDLSITNGTPSNPGNMPPVTITGWGVAIVTTLPSWNEINNWQWVVHCDTPIYLYPGQTIHFPTPTPTPTLTPTPTTGPTATPTPTDPPGGSLLSQGKAATASSFQAGNEVAKGNDGSLTTRWSASGGTFPQWWKVDLGAGYNLSRVDINWYSSSSRSYKYKIEVSTNNVTFTTVVDKTGNTATGDTSDSFSATARYVRITVTGASAGWASAYEFKVYGN
jgi:hypothetical protein